MKRYRAQTLYMCPVCGGKAPRHGEPCLSDDPPSLRPMHEPVEYVPSATAQGAVDALARIGRSASFVSKDRDAQMMARIAREWLEANGYPTSGGQ